MLDSCQYEPKNLVEGRIKAETLVWMDEQLKKAQEDGMQILPIGPSQPAGPEPYVYNPVCHGQ